VAQIAPGSPETFRFESCRHGRLGCCSIVRCLALSWGKVGVELWTHSVGGFSENDFILAAKIEALPRA
jgi:hypothetical protein